MNTCRLFAIDLAFSAIWGQQNFLGLKFDIWNLGVRTRDGKTRTTAKWIKVVGLCSLLFNRTRRWIYYRSSKYWTFVKKDEYIFKNSIRQNQKLLSLDLISIPFLRIESILIEQTTVHISSWQGQEQLIPEACSIIQWVHGLVVCSDNRYWKYLHIIIL